MTATNQPRILEITPDLVGAHINLDDLVTACCREASIETLLWRTDREAAIGDEPSRQLVPIACAPKGLGELVATKLSKAPCPGCDLPCVRDERMTVLPSLFVAYTPLRGGATEYTLVSADCEECGGDGLDVVGYCQICNGDGVAVDVGRLAAKFELPFVSEHGHNLGKFRSFCCDGELLPVPESRIVCFRCRQSAFPGNWHNPANGPRVASFVVL